ncbi:MAG: metallophosphoesterase [Xylanivirga thermophila]|jgi:uncharacterized protein|uniref:metallophosphoesterase n=1 Tax=Xylanivirga thermophila TaxID=2496273 RepID=UPI00101C12C0|nr:metallophosphoesterase [Xylanivirga thermophila]
MKIAIISDTHGKQLSLRNILNKVKDVDRIFHLGDFVKDAAYIQNTVNVPIDYVKGNCDYDSNTDYSKIIELEGKRFFLTHGHLYDGAHNFNKMLNTAKRSNIDVFLFGHTHIPKIEHIEDKLFINPGSPSQPRGGYRPTIAIIELVNQNITPWIVNV